MYADLGSVNFVLAVVAHGSFFVFFGPQVLSPPRHHIEIHHMCHIFDIQSTRTDLKANGKPKHGNEHPWQTYPWL